MTLLVVALATGGCGAEGAGPTSDREPKPAVDTTASLDIPPPPVLAPAVLPQLDHEQRLLDAAALVDETVGGPTLAADLDRWGYRGGRERAFRGSSRDLTSVVSRTLVFADPSGATAFVDYATANGGFYLGGVATTEAVHANGRSGVVMTAEGCGCHGETPLLLYVAGKGNRVAWLMINGPRASPDRVLALAARAP